MSHDQASRLRSLALRTLRTTSVSPVPSTRTIVVSSGERRLGGTTLAVHLSISLARQGQRVVLVDADLETAGASLLSRVHLSPGLTDVLTERRNIHEVLQRGPAGIQVLAGSQSASERRLLTDKTAERLMRQLAGLSRHTDVVVLDVPCQEAEPRGESQLHGPLVSFWQHADDLLLVTSGDDSAVMNTYALLKSCWSRTVVLPRLHIAVNHARDSASASDVHVRLDRSSQRFLKLPLNLAGSLPTSPDAAGATGISDNAFDLALEQIAQRLLNPTTNEEVRIVA
ncbi:MAG: AAA family ATPase [Planctomycetales bacterium]|nr:AAA family ATPase [Planctomycetales bacterium]